MRPAARVLGAVAVSTLSGIVRSPQGADAKKLLRLSLGLKLDLEAI